MTDKHTNNLNMPGFSAVYEAANHIKEMMRPALEMTQRIRETFQPFVKAIDQYQSQIKRVTKRIAEAVRPLSAIKKLGDAQFVYWEYMSEEFVDDIITANNVNKLLREYMVKDKFKFTNETIIKCRANPLMIKHLRLFNQAIDAFYNGSNDLAVNGLASVFDGLLAETSGKSTHRLPPRVDEIKKKLENDELLDNDEYATLTFAYTFEKTVDSYIAPASFDKKEPKGLNRHWIAHGRSTRRKTKLDCIKMINLIYGLLLISELDEKAMEKQSDT